jgi:hypothetical protein
MIRALAAAGLLFFAPAVPGAFAQSQDPPAPASQVQNPPAAAAQTRSSNATKPKPKKVWTNENLGDAGGTISVVGSAKTASAAKPDSKPRPTADNSIDPRLIARLREQLQRLQAQLAVIDQQIANLKGLSKGDSKNAGGLNQNTWGYNSSPIEEQIRQLQAKKTKVQAAIDEIIDGARANGIEPGQLR